MRGGERPRLGIGRGKGRYWPPPDIVSILLRTLGGQWVQIVWAARFETLGILRERYCALGFDWVLAYDRHMRLEVEKCTKEYMYVWAKDIALQWPAQRRARAPWHATTDY